MIIIKRKQLFLGSLVIIILAGGVVFLKRNVINQTEIRSLNGCIQRERRPRELSKSEREILARLAEKGQIEMAKPLSQTEAYTVAANGFEVYPLPSVDTASLNIPGTPAIRIQDAMDRVLAVRRRHGSIDGTCYEDFRYPSAEWDVKKIIFVLSAARTLSWGIWGRCFFVAVDAQDGKILTDVNTCLY